MSQEQRTLAHLGVASAYKNAIAEEFQRLCKKSRSHLVLEEMLKFQAKGATLPIDFCHLGVLWVLDRDHDGKVTIDDFYDLADLCWQRRQCYQTFEYSAQLHAYCSLQLWKSLNAPGGDAAFVDWVCALLIENSPERRRFWRHGLQQYLSTDSMQALHQLFRIQELNGTDFQAFFDLLQRVGEEQALLDLGDEEQDDWVPLGVVREFVGAASSGAARLLIDICPVDVVAEGEGGSGARTGTNTSGSHHGGST